MPRLRRWAPVFVWAAAILVMTSWPSPTESTDLTGFDKVAHFGVYAFLGWLVGDALIPPRSHRQLALAAIALAVFALLDELHQLWIPGRSATVGDWSADLLGATIGLAVLHLRATFPTSQPDAAS